jgi:hypothetical protein
MTGLLGAGDVEAVRIWRWVFPNAGTRAAAARNVIETDSRLQLFDDLEAPALLAIGWEPRPEAPPVHNAELAWSTDAQRIASWRAERSETPGCLVVVRQPLKAPDPAAQRDWVSTVLRALDGDATPPEGLLTANFFAGRDGASVYNLAEWTSAEAHRTALTIGRHGPYGSIGFSDLWRAAREHPAITAEHEVRRYARHGALVSA